MGDLRANSRSVAGTRRTMAVALMLSAGLLAGCSTAFSPGPSQVASQTPAKPEMSAANLREHQRILAAYGGVYTHPRLEPLLAQTVERLVASSERPDLKYEVTILNSPSVNAFALPS